jgi:hypothetical protein
MVCQLPNSKGKALLMIFATQKRTSRADFHWPYSFHEGKRARGLRSLFATILDDVSYGVKEVYHFNFLWLPWYRKHILDKFKVF